MSIKNDHYFILVRGAPALELNLTYYATAFTIYFGCVAKLLSYSLQKNGAERVEVFTVFLQYTDYRSEIDNFGRKA